MEAVSVVVPIMGQLADTKSFWGLLKMVTVDPYELVVIQNGEDDAEEFIRHYLKPKRLKFVEHGNAGGLIGALNRGIEESSGEIIAFIHNDLFIYEVGWNRRVEEFFTAFKEQTYAPTLPGNPALVGFFGAQGTAANGGRYDSWGAMLEAEIHGSRLTKLYQPASQLDGISLVGTKKFFEEAGGFDTGYLFHHFYDRDICLTALSLGYDVAILNVPCHHWNGITANRSEYAEWVNRHMSVAEGGDLMTHTLNQERFNAKWGEVLSVYVEDDFTFRSSPPFKGDAIRGYKCQ